MASSYRSVLERYGAARYEDLWEHPFLQLDLDALTDWIRRQEPWAELFTLQDIVRQQIRLLGTRTPEPIAAALGQSPERVAGVMRQRDRQYATRRELDLHYWTDPDQV